MLDPTEDNPLGIPLGQDNLPHQLRLTWPEGTNTARRTNLCTLVLEHLAEIQGPWDILFQ